MRAPDGKGSISLESFKEANVKEAKGSRGGDVEDADNQTTEKIRFLTGAMAARRGGLRRTDETQG
jgi:hypothetical protein